MTSIRILLALATIFGQEIQQMDVVAAFFAGYLTEEIYMEGFDVEGEDMVCKVVKSLYELKQALWVLNLQIQEYLKSIVFTQIYLDPCMYINKANRIILIM